MNKLLHLLEQHNDHKAKQAMIKNLSVLRRYYGISKLYLELRSDKTVEEYKTISLGIIRELTAGIEKHKKYPKELLLQLQFQSHEDFERTARSDIEERRLSIALLEECERLEISPVFIDDPEYLSGPMMTLNSIESFQTAMDAPAWKKRTAHRIEQLKSSLDTDPQQVVVVLSGVGHINDFKALEATEVRNWFVTSHADEQRRETSVINHFIASAIQPTETVPHDMLESHLLKPLFMSDHYLKSMKSAYMEFIASLHRDEMNPETIMKLLSVIRNEKKTDIEKLGTMLRRITTIKNTTTLMTLLNRFNKHFHDDFEEALMQTPTTGAKISARDRLVRIYDRHPDLQARLKMLPALTTDPDPSVSVGAPTP